MGDGYREIIMCQKYILSLNVGMLGGEMMVTPLDLVTCTNTHSLLSMIWNIYYVEKKQNVQQSTIIL